MTNLFSSFTVNTSKCFINFLLPHRRSNWPALFGSLIVPSVLLCVCPVGIKVVHAVDSKAEGMTEEVKRTTGFLQFKQRHKVHHHVITTANTSTCGCDLVPGVGARPRAVPCLRDCAVAIIDLVNFQ